MDHLFQTELQTSLTELQSNLKELEASRIQIQEAKDAASKVVNGMDGLRENYSSYLDNINTQVNGFLSTSDQQLRTKINDGVTNIRETSLEMLNLHKEQGESNRQMMEEVISKVENLRKKHDDQLEAINEKVEALMSNSGNRLDDNLTQNTQMIQDLSNAILGIHQENSQKTNSFAEDLRNKQADYLTTIEQQHNTKITALTSTTQSTIDQAASNIQSSVSQLTSDLQAHIQHMNTVFSQQQEQTQHYLDRFAQTLEAVRGLEDRINKIDFPFYFKKLEETTTNINTKVNKFGDQFEEHRKEYKGNFVQITQELADQRKKQSEQIDGVKNFLYFLTFLLIVVGALLFFKEIIMPA